MYTMYANVSSNTLLTLMLIHTLYVESNLWAHCPIKRVAILCELIYLMAAPPSQN